MGMRRLSQFVRKYPKTAISIAVLVGIGILLTALTIFQTNYYSNRALPNTYAGDLHLGNKTRGEIGYALLENNQSTKLMLDTGNGVRELSYYDAGLSPDYAYMSEAAVSRPWWQLMIPAPLMQYMQKNTISYTYAIDDEKISELVATINETEAKPPTDARFEVSNGAPVIVPAQPGATFDASVILDTLQNTPFQPGVTVRLNPSAVAPTVTEASFDPVKQAADKLIQNPPTLVINGTRLDIPPEELAAWFTTTENTVTGQTLTFKTDIILAYVQKLNETYFIPAQPGSITLLDGTEVGRTNGVSGLGIDNTGALQAIMDGLATNATEVTLPLSRIDARLSVNRSYSNSDSGLYSLIADLVKEYGDYAISVEEIGGAGRTADYKGDNVYVAASTYKLFIAIHALQTLEADEINFNDPFAGLTVDRCFELMIDHSDNYCAGQFIQYFSRAVLTSSMHDNGFANTNFAEDTVYTTANDLNNLLIKLIAGELVNETNRDKLLELMKHQIYRNGIPTAARDSVVANKVGYVNGYRHDTGIVYGPNSTYTLTILSYGGSYPEIVAITKKIHAFMQQ